MKRARRKARPGWAAVLLLGTMGATCGRGTTPPAAVEHIDLTLQPVEGPKDLGERALAHVAKLVSFGPRWPGSPGWQKGIEYIAAQLKEAGLEPVRDRFTDKVEDIAFENISATIAGTQKDRIVLGCHHDTKKTVGHDDPKQNFVFVGANDSGSGVGLLLALAPWFAQHPRRATIELVFLDGEESLDFKWNKARALFGSRRYVRRNEPQQGAKQPSKPGAVRAFVLLDMVGAKDLHIDEDTNSDPVLRDIVRHAARAAGHARFFFAKEQTVTDDHTPFLDAGIPAVDLIDLADNPQWHTADDTLEHLAPESLQVVGEVVLTALPEIERRFVPAPLATKRAR